MPSGDPTAADVDVPRTRDELNDPVPVLHEMAGGGGRSLDVVEGDGGNRESSGARSIATTGAANVVAGATQGTSGR